MYNRIFTWRKKAVLPLHRTWESPEARDLARLRLGIKDQGRSHGECLPTKASLACLNGFSGFLSGTQEAWNDWLLYRHSSVGGFFFRIEKGRGGGRKKSLNSLPRKVFEKGSKESRHLNETVAQVK